jgi:hypothetical protein
MIFRDILIVTIGERYWLLVGRGRENGKPSALHTISLHGK